METQKQIKPVQGFELDTSMVELDQPTVEAVVTNVEYGGRNMAVAFVDNREKLADSDEMIGPTIIWLQSYRARMEPSETQRLVTIAQQLRKAGKPVRVASVELPGMGINEDSNATFWQKINLLRGNFDGLSNDMLFALNKVLKFKDGEKVEFALFSQGAVLGAYVIEDLQNKAFGINVKIPKVTIFEEVNDKRLNLNLAKIGDEIELKDKKTNEVTHSFVDSYLEDNSAFPWLVNPWDKTLDFKERQNNLDVKQKGMINLGAIGLLTASFPAVYERALKAKGDTGIENADIRIVKLADSKVSSYSGNIDTLKRIKNLMVSGHVGLTLVTAVEGREKLTHIAATTSMLNMAALTNKFLK